MDALVMCGGRGTRFDADVEKPLFAVCGEPMVDRGLAALAGSRVETTYAVVSPNAPATRDHLRDTDVSRSGDGADTIELVETAGDGYVDDLMDALDRPDIEPPLLTVAADLPLLDPAVVDRVLDAYDDRRSVANAGAGAGAPSMIVGVPVALKRRLGVAIESRLPERTGVAPTGINVVGPTAADADEDADANADANAEPKRRQVIHVSYDQRLAINVNRLEDARTAETLLAEREDDGAGTAENEEDHPCA